MKFVRGVVMVTSLVRAEEAAWTKDSRGFMGCQTEGSESRIARTLYL
jgi:hypothetical protein